VQPKKFIHLFCCYSLENEDRIVGKIDKLGLIENLIKTVHKAFRGELGPMTLPKNQP